MTVRSLRRIVWVVIPLIIIAGAIYFFGGPLRFIPLPPASASTAELLVSDLPGLLDKPQPSSITYDGCPPQGMGGDSELNLLQNRVDDGKYTPVTFDSITTLTWPKSVEQVDMKDWSALNRSFISQYEGLPIMVEGYFGNLREDLPQPANCNRTNGSNLDWRISLTQNPKDDRSQAIMAVVTPRVRLGHNWTIDQIHAVLIGAHAPVRVYGWLYFDPNHPDDVGVTRATLWEIHPVMQIELYQNGRWNPLDRYVK